MALAVAAAMVLLLGAVGLAAGAFTGGDDDAPATVAATATSAAGRADPATGASVSTSASATAGAPPVATGSGCANRFDARRALALARLQVEVGQRPAGSPQLQALAKRLVARLPRGRLEPVRGHRGLNNVVGSLPGREPAILIGAHYDTESTPKGFVGANDSAAGTAVLLEVARVLRGLKRPEGARAIRFALFDGEEEPRPTNDFYRDALRSKDYVRAHRRAISKLILLDYVGNKGLRVPREGSSDKALWSRLRAAARRAGVASFFPPGVGADLLDDHTPFLRAGIPSIDLIDFTYPHADTLRDTLDKLRVASLDAVGEAVVELVLDERRR